MGTLRPSSRSVVQTWFIQRLRLGAELRHVFPDAAIARDDPVKGAVDRIHQPAVALGGIVAGPHRHQPAGFLEAGEALVVGPPAVVECRQDPPGA